jgi:poly(A) polymerase
LTSDSAYALREFAIEVVRRLREAGFDAYWAGGCVRDFLLGIQPADFDIATNAQPPDIRKLFGFGNTLPVGAAFGGIIVQASDRRHQVEVATFRTDSSYSDGRRPDWVTFSTPEVDAQRRDFTINGMFYDPLAAQVIDFVGGQQDLERHIVRAIGNADARISEDKLRMLRAVRIAARFGFEIEDETYRAIGRHAQQAIAVSGERLAVELRKTLETDASAWAVQAWAETGLLQVLLPEVDASWQEKNCAQQIVKMLGLTQECTWLSRLSALLWAAVGRHCQETTGQLKVRLRLSNDQAAAINFALAHQTTLAEAEHVPWSQLQPLLVSPWASIAVELLEMRCHIGQANLQTIQWLRQRLAWPVEQLDPPPLLTGQDLIQSGFRPDPRFKDWLFQVRCLQLDGKLSTKDQAIRLVSTEY